MTLSLALLCEVCGEDLTDIPCQHLERRTKIDIVFEKVVEHIDAQVKQCPSCETMTKGVFPSDMPGPLQYGSGLKAYIVNLLVCHMVAINRVQKLIKSMVGVIIHDCLAAYFSYDHCNHGLCGSHLLRELTFIIEANGYRWAKEMKSLLQEAYQRIVVEGEKELPAIPPKPSGKRGKLAKSDAHNHKPTKKRFYYSLITSRRLELHGSEEEKATW